MAANYPHLNEWPEWFTVEPGRRMFGFALRKGLALTVAGGGEARVEVSQIPPRRVPEVLIFRKAGLARRRFTRSFLVAECGHGRRKNRCVVYCVSWRRACC